MRNHMNVLMLDGSDDNYYNSSNIERVIWTPQNQVKEDLRHKYTEGRLIIRFKDGGQYAYNEPYSTFEELERRARVEHVKKAREKSYHYKTAGQYYSSDQWLHKHSKYVDKLGD